MSKLVDQFDSRHRLFQTYCERLTSLMSQLIADRGIAIHSLTSRVKDKSSFQKKVTRNPSKYSDISEVTDVVGVRIITFFADQVNQLAELIQQEFVVDAANSMNKGDVLDPDRFGYLSLHYVIGIGGPRADLAEYRPINSLKAEIQIRSILQHAWAEIEHDLGYKTTGQVPRKVRRQFARLAGLLELADAEFVAIRDKLAHYTAEVSEQIVAAPSSVALDKVSLLDLVRSDELLLHSDVAVAAAFQNTVEQSEDTVASMVDRLQHFDLATIEDVKRELKRNVADVLALAQRWARIKDDPGSPRPGESLNEGISLFYLCYALAGTKGASHAKAYLDRFEIGAPDDGETAGECETRAAIARELAEFFEERRRSRSPS